MLEYLILINSINNIFSIVFFSLLSPSLFITFYILISTLRNLDISMLQIYKSSTLYDTVSYNKNG